MSSQETPLMKELQIAASRLGARLEKVCTVCCVSKTIDNFPKVKLGKYGVGAWCKPCFAEYGRKKRLENLDRERERSRKWAEKNKAKVIENVYRLRKESPDHYADYRKKWREENPEKVSAHYANKHSKRRSAIDATHHKLTAQEWRDILDQHNHRCNYCGCRGKLQKDHVIPLSRGGMHNAANVVPACGACNNSKNASTVEEWLARKVGDVPCLLKLH